MSHVSTSLRALLSALVLAVSAVAASSATVTRVIDMSFGQVAPPEYYGSVTVAMDTTANTGGSLIPKDNKLSILALDLFVAIGGGNYAQIASDPAVLGDVRYIANNGRLLLLRFGTALSLSKAGDFNVTLRVPNLGSPTENILAGDFATGTTAYSCTSNGMTYFYSNGNGQSYCPPAGGFKVSELPATPPATPIPLPAGGLMLLTGLGALAALRRRRA